MSELEVTICRYLARVVLVGILAILYYGYKKIDETYGNHPSKSKKDYYGPK